MTARRDERHVGDSLDAITEALLTASRLLVAISARSLAQVDETITLPQFRTLVILAARRPVNVTTLARLLDVQTSTTGRMVERLVNSGMISRRPHPDSRRELVVELTSRGEQIVRAVTDYRREAIAQVVRKMPESDRHDLVRSLNAFTSAGDEPAARTENHTYLM
jgi:DNA-binding MarR family transcriptional regulator